MANAVRCDTCCEFIYPVTEERPVNEVVSVGFECPLCKTWYHAYWHSDELEPLRQAIEVLTSEAQINPTRYKILQKRLKSYRKLFDRLQQRMTAEGT